MRNKLKVALLAGAVAAGVLAAASPAQAALTDCPVGNFCIWSSTNYGGTRWTFNKSSIDAGTNHGIRLGTFATNQGSSFYNHTTVKINIYDSNDCEYSPWTRTMSSGQYATAQGSDWDNRVSSIQITAEAPYC